MSDKVQSLPYPEYDIEGRDSLTDVPIGFIIKNIDESFSGDTVFQYYTGFEWKPTYVLENGINENVSVEVEENVLFSFYKNAGSGANTFYIGIDTDNSYLSSSQTLGLSSYNTTSRLYATYYENKSERQTLVGKDTNTYTSVLTNEPGGFLIEINTSSTGPYTPSDLDFSFNENGLSVTASEHTPFNGISYGSRPSFTTNTLIDVTYFTDYLSDTLAGNGLQEKTGVLSVGGSLTANLSLDIANGDFLLDGTTGSNGYIYFGGSNGVQEFATYANYASFQCAVETIISVNNGSEGGSFTIDLTETVYRDLRTTETGIKYYADYSATLGDRSLPDVAYTKILGHQSTIQAITTDYTVLRGDHIIEVDATSGAIEIELPDPTTLNDGLEIIIDPYNATNTIKLFAFSKTGLDVDTITLIGSPTDTVRYTMNGSPDLSGVSIGDYIKIETALNSGNNGVHVITAVNDGSDYIDIVNAAGVAETSDSPATLKNMILDDETITTDEIRKYVAYSHRDSYRQIY